MGHDETWSTAVPKYGDVETYAGWIEDQVRRCADRGFAERFQKGCPIEGVSVESYLHRVVETPTGKVLAGIRFRGGNLSEPFVDVLAATNPVPSSTLIATIANEFKEFQPIWIRIALPTSDELPWPTFNEDAFVDQHFLAGLANQTMSSQVQPARDLDWYDDFQREFSHWQDDARSRNLTVADTVQPCSREELQECLEEGHIVVARDESNRFRGVAATLRSTERSFSGWCVMEEFVVLEAQGKGLGAKLQSSLMPQIKGELLWGTIDGSNLPSLATAKRCQREIVETWWFVKTQFCSAVNDPQRTQK